MFKKMKPKITMCNTHRSFKNTKSYISDSLEVSMVNADVHDSTLGQCAVDDDLGMFCIYKVELLRILKYSRVKCEADS